MSGDKPAYTLTIDLPHQPKGEEVQIAGLGTFENGKSYDVTKAEADAFRSRGRRHHVVTDEDGSTHTEVEEGPTLLEASKAMYGVEVETASKQKSPPRGNNDDNNGGDS